MILELPCHRYRTLNLLNHTGFLQSHCSRLARSLWMVPSFACVPCPAQLPVSCKGARGELDPTLCGIDNDIKEPWSHGRVWRRHLSSLTSTCTWSTDHSPLAVSIQTTAPAPNHPAFTARAVQPGDQDVVWGCVESLTGTWAQQGLQVWESRG